MSQLQRNSLLTVLWTETSVVFYMAKSGTVATPPHISMAVLSLFSDKSKDRGCLRLNRWTLAKLAPQENEST